MDRHEPLLSIWFGNFYSPAYDDRAFVDASMHQLKKLGFNTVELDSKDWQDFREAFSGGQPSDYVSMQTYMREAAHREGLGHMFLALYLNGDNLYPNIRFSPPVYGESVTAADGTDGRWYKYWSEKSRSTQAEHVAQLEAYCGDGQTVIDINGEERIPICSMWDPIVAPSFDKDGVARYTGWLKQRYGTIEALNRQYGTAFEDFDQLQPGDYWFSVRYGEGALYSREDLADCSPRFTLWADNMRWRADELTAYFASMKERLHQIDPRLYLMPNLSQWSHFLNIDTSSMPDVGLCDLWDTANRGIDLRAVAPHVDMAHWFTLPVSMDGTPDAYVVSCQHAHIRSMNQGHDWLGGIYWGRFLYHDVYRTVTPEETIGSIVAAGAKGISAYGWCGLDDGGILHRMDEDFLGSLSRANQWAKKVIPQLGRRKRSRVAILFPTEMSLLEPLGIEGAAFRRSDLLGLYHFCCDHGYAPDIVEKPDVLTGLSGYDILLIPSNDCWHVQRDPAMEDALRRYVSNGRTIIHSSLAEPALFAFGQQMCKTENTGYLYCGEGGLLSKETVYAPSAGEPLALWCGSGLPCVSRMQIGQGQVFSFGFMPGYQYIAKQAPHVPPEQRNHALYPFTHMEHNVLRDLLQQYSQPMYPDGMKDVELASFDNGWIVVNHRSTPVRVPFAGKWIRSCPGLPGILSGHSAVWIRKEKQA